MINEAVAKGALPFKWFGFDSAFGVERAFLEALPEDCYYFSNTRSNQLVFESRPKLTISVANKKYRPFKHQRPSFSPVKVSKYTEDENLPW